MPTTRKRTTSKASTAQILLWAAEDYLKDPALVGDELRRAFDVVYDGGFYRGGSSSDEDEEEYE